MPQVSLFGREDLYLWQGGLAEPALLVRGSTLWSTLREAVEMRVCLPFPKPSASISSTNNAPAHIPASCFAIAVTARMPESPVPTARNPVASHVSLAVTKISINATLRFRARKKNHANQRHFLRATARDVSKRSSVCLHTSIREAHSASLSNATTNVFGRSATASSPRRSISSRTTWTIISPIRT